MNNKKITKPKPRGRPQVSTLKRLTKSVTVKFSKPDYEKLRHRSKNANRTLAEYIRDAAFEARIVAKHSAEDAAVIRNLIGMANNLNQLTKLSHQTGFYRRKEVQMIGKIKKGKSFGGCVRYVMGKDDAKILESDGVLLGTNREMIESFNCQCLLNPKIKQPLGHIALSFKPEDAPRLTDEFMAKIALEYMELMGIKNTQFILVRHHNTDNPHCHLVYNRINYDGKVISSQNDFKRNEIATKRLKDKYGLTYAEDKSKTNVKKLHDPERVKYGIHNAVKAALKRSRTWWDLGNQLQKQGIGMTFKINRRTGKNEGLSFTKDGYTFKASDISRQFSYSKLNEQLSWDKPKMQTEIEPKQQPIRQEEERNYSVTDNLIESNGMGLFTPSDTPQEDEQAPSWQKKKKDKKKKNRGIRF